MPIYCEPPSYENGTYNLEESKELPESGFTGQAIKLDKDNGELTFQNIMHTDDRKWIIGKSISYFMNSDLFKICFVIKYFISFYQNRNNSLRKNLYACLLFIVK